MDDLIVIILTLLIVVIGVLGQIKKKKSGQQPTPRQKEGGGFWDFLEMEPETSMKQPNEVYQVSEESAIEPEIQEEKSQYTFTPEEESSPVQKNDLTLSEKKRVVKKISRYPLDFSLRKAVIYSEILNRKYF